MPKRTIQYLTEKNKVSQHDEHIDEILQWMDDYTQLIAGQDPLPSKAISIRVEGRLLALFKQKCQLNGVAYQSKIKELMSDWLQK